MAVKDCLVCSQHVGDQFCSVSFETVLGRGLHLPRASILHKDAMWTLVLGGRGRKLAHPGHLPQVRNPLILMVLLPVSP